MRVKKFGYQLDYNIEFVGCGFQEHYFTTFKNGYSASIIRGYYTYGGEKNLYEVAALDEDGEIVYDKFGSDDVLGFLSEKEVKKALSIIENL